MSGGVFISYRRADSRWAAARLFDTLTAAFPGRPVFMDVAEISPGEDFAEVLARQVREADVLLALIGPDWETGGGGGSRFDDAADFVRIEVEAALADPSTTVIPVLLDGAKAPTEAALPDGLKPLARRQFARLSHEGYRAEIGVLTDAVDRALGAAVPAAPPRRSRKPIMAALGVLAALAAGAAAVAFRPPAGSPLRSRPA
ncbi:MAG: toll/interleukin-1 receptor domain-containing protein, partial [Pseudomonadota bacterium]